MTEFDYHADTAIDPDQLLEEWLEMPSTFHDYTDHLAYIEKKVKTTWEKLKTIRSELILKAKTEDGLGNPKATLLEVEAYYRTQPEYQQAKKDLIEIEYEQSMILNAVKAMYRKEKSIDGAVELHKMEWWRGPKNATEIKPGKRLKERFRKQTSSVEKRQKTNRRRRKQNG